MFLWDTALSAAERNQVGQAAYTELLARHGHDDGAGGVGWTPGRSAELAVVRRGRAPRAVPSQCSAR